jgi:hypothetical protein
MRTSILLLSLLAVAAVAQETPKGDTAQRAPAAAEPATADAAPAPTAPSGPKTMSGMSILGNEEAPKSLVIVPWKSSKLGDGLGVENALDARPRAIDREVFMRELHYYELRSGESE